MKRVVLGIDLGMCNSRVAYINEFHRPVVIPNQEGKTTTPSVVHFFDKDSFVVGDEAVHMVMVDQTNTACFIKRSMGNPDFKLNIHGKEYTPQEISALILKKLKSDAESYFRNLGMDAEIKDAVITVPSYFYKELREATKEAGELAGINVLSLINEPTAAALSFGINQLGKEQTVFVFDLGGGTFDVTILDIKGNEINMIASDGDPELGGKDWDDVLVSYCSSQFKEKHGKDPQDDPNSCQDLYNRVVARKLSLSTRPKTVITVSHKGNRETVEISRAEFEELSKELIAECMTKCKRVMEKAQKTWNDIDTVLLVGGSTQMPMIRNMVKEISGKEPSTRENPEECVAIGAAYSGHYISGQGRCEACEKHFEKARESDQKVSQVIDEDKKVEANDRPTLPMTAKVVEDFKRVDSFLAYVRTIDTFQDVTGIYDFFEIRHPNAPYSEVESKINEKIMIYAGHSAPKYKPLARVIVKSGELAKRILRDYREHYDEYHLKNRLSTKILNALFRFATKAGVISEADEEYITDEGLRLGMRRTDITALLHQWIAEFSNKKKQREIGMSTSESLEGKTYYDILNVLGNSDYKEIKAAYEGEHQKYIMTRDVVKARARFAVVSEAWECLRDAVTRKDYDLRLKESR